MRLETLFDGHGPTVGHPETVCKLVVRPWSAPNVVTLLNDLCSLLPLCINILQDYVNLCVGIAEKFSKNIPYQCHGEVTLKESRTSALSIS